MKETTLQTINYRGYRLIESRREIDADQADVVQMRWCITQVVAGIENIIGEAPSLDAAKAKVDAILAK